MANHDQQKREIDNTLGKSDERPDSSMSITRRTFLHKSLITGVVAGAATYGIFPFINTIDLAFGAQDFKFAWLSDTHLYPKKLNTRFVEKTVRAVEEITAMNPPADFLIFGGDLAQLGDPVELRLGNDILKEIKIKKVFIPGEHDWYLDMGKEWRNLFGDPNWSFDHKGVRFIGLDTISRAPNYWSKTKMTAKERMGHMATLDGSVAGQWAGLGRTQLRWLDSKLASWGKNKPVVIFSHNPLYEYYPPWNFWVRDWKQVHEILRPYSNITNIHGHTHQVLYNEVGKMRSIGMLATSWPWPYAPTGVPAKTKPFIRVDPGDHFDGVGWSQITVGNRVENKYMMWRDEILAKAKIDSGTGDNDNQILHPRLADRL